MKSTEMKTMLYDAKGNKKSEIALPEIFKGKVREDIALKYFESRKMSQPYAKSEMAGRKHSASGIVSHKRRDWKGHYGRGVSRIPRKVMWRRGTQFNWIGAEVSGTRGGRKIHGPKGIGKEKKINKREIKIAMNSGFAATANAKYISQRHSNLDALKPEVTPTPIVVESKLDGVKTKELFGMLKNIFGNTFPFVLRRKRIRAGKGKLRGRKYKSNAGLLFVKGEKERIKSKGIEIKTVGNIEISDLYPLGRIAVYTEDALKELEERGKNQKTKARNIK